MQRSPFKGGSPCNDCEAGRYMYRWRVWMEMNLMKIVLVVIEMLVVRYMASVVSMNGDGFNEDKESVMFGKLSVRFMV